MLKAIYPGSFDPVTKGHLDIINRACTFSDLLVVAILENPNKKSLFTIEERKEHLKIVTKNIKNVEIQSFQGLLVDFAEKIHASIIIRGLRNSMDFDNEFQRYLVNNKLKPNIETLFLAANEKHLSLSSSAVKEVAVFKGNIDFMVPDEIKSKVVEKYMK